MKNEIVYVSYTGLLEALGKSQILSYLKILSDNYSITLLTFEKQSDLNNIYEYNAMMDICEQYNIDWRPMLYHKRFRLLSKMRDSFNLLKNLYKINKEKNIKLFHCRAYVSTINVWLFTRLFKIPYIFDMRALWIDELVEAGSIKNNGLLTILLRKMESKILLDSDAIISLTEHAVKYLINNNEKLEEKKFIVIPTCVDIERFKFDISTYRKEKDGKIVVGSMGSILSSRFDIQLFLSILLELQKNKAIGKIKIVTLDDSEKIYESFKKIGGNIKDLEIYSSSYEDIPYNISNIDIAIVTFKTGVSTLGTSPTRIGEFLAQGIPVICTENVGDSSELIEFNNVGITVSNNDFIIEDNKILDLIDINKKSHCRQVAIDYYSVTSGCNKLSKIYKELVCGYNEK